MRRDPLSLMVGSLGSGGELLVVSTVQPARFDPSDTIASRGPGGKWWHGVMSGLCRDRRFEALTLTASALQAVSSHPFQAAWGGSGVAAAAWVAYLVAGLLVGILVPGTYPIEIVKRGLRSFEFWLIPFLVVPVMMPCGVLALPSIYGLKVYWAIICCTVVSLQQLDCCPNRRIVWLPMGMLSISMAVACAASFWGFNAMDKGNFIIWGREINLVNRVFSGQLTVLALTIRMTYNAYMYPNRFIYIRGAEILVVTETVAVNLELALAGKIDPAESALTDLPSDAHGQQIKETEVVSFQQCETSKHIDRTAVHPVPAQDAVVVPGSKPKRATMLLANSLKSIPLGDQEESVVHLLWPTFFPMTVDISNTWVSCLGVARHDTLSRFLATRLFSVLWPTAYVLTGAALCGSLDGQAPLALISILLAAAVVRAMETNVLIVQLIVTNFQVLYLIGILSLVTLAGWLTLSDRTNATLWVLANLAVPIAGMLNDARPSCTAEVWERMVFFPTFFVFSVFSFLKLFRGEFIYVSDDIVLLLGVRLSIRQCWESLQFSVSVLALRFACRALFSRDSFLVDSCLRLVRVDATVSRQLRAAHQAGMSFR